MTEETRYTAQEFHKKMAVDLFNAVWGLLDQPERAPDENLKMLHMAHASRHHWGEVGTPLNLARRMADFAGLCRVMFHAQTCLAICQEHGLAILISPLPTKPWPALTPSPGTLPSETGISNWLTKRASRLRKRMIASTLLRNWKRFRVEPIHQQPHPQHFRHTPRLGDATVRCVRRISVENLADAAHAVVG